MTVMYFIFTVSWDIPSKNAWRTDTGPEGKMAKISGIGVTLVYSLKRSLNYDLLSYITFYTLFVYIYIYCICSYKIFVICHWEFHLTKQNGPVMNLPNVVKRWNLPNKFWLRMNYKLVWNLKKWNSKLWSYIWSWWIIILKWLSNFIVVSKLYG